MITAALSANSEMTHDPRLAGRLHSSGKYITIQGTSMATPFVAGLVALMLQQEPRLTPEEVQQRLRITAQRDTTTGKVWNPHYGWGNSTRRHSCAVSGQQALGRAHATQ